MPKDKSERIKVIALGGSIINPGKPDIEFLKKFRQMIIRFIKDEGYKFLIVVGGGRLCRIFQSSLKKISPDIPNEILDWLGIKVTHLNAYFTSKIFDKNASPKILTSFNQRIFFGHHNIIFGAGVKPGWSTDFDAFYWAKRLGVKVVFLPTNVKYIFDKDPKKFPSAKSFKEISWNKYTTLISGKWTPGLNIPIDQKAADFAKKEKMIAYVFNGKDLTNFKKVIAGENFIGTVVKS